MYNNKTSRRAPKKTKINQISEPMAGRDINVIIEQYQEKLSIMYPTGRKNRPPVLDTMIRT